MDARPLDHANGSPIRDPHKGLLNCDLVMKGGITSGVVYPKAVVRLARRYRIRSIGGTSVGAIAAALTAAAEYWRQTHAGQQPAQDERIAAVIEAMEEAGWDSADPKVKQAEARLTGTGNPDRAHGYAALYAIPQEIGSNLLTMFQPSRTTRGLFNYLVSNLGANTPGAKVVAAVVRQFYVFRIVTTVLAVLVALTLLRTPSLGLSIAALVFTTVALMLLDSTIFGYFTAKPPARMPPTDGRGEEVLAAGAIAAIFVLLLAPTLGWEDFGAVWDRVAGHRYMVLTLVIGTVLIVTWKWIRQLLLRPFHDDRRRVAGAILDGLSVVTMIAVVGWLGMASRELGTGVGIAAIGVMVGWVVGGILALCYYLLFALPRNFNGICTGLGTSWALTNWLTAKIDEVAAEKPGHHLTCGDLHDHKIEFEAITSDLTRGVPLDVPRALEHYQFRPAEFSRLFPPTVLDQLGVPAASLKSHDLMAFPAWEQVPVVVAARMSMSFPILFSAVPVYHISEGPQPSRANWLSDGGIVSNFPLHKFDRALPPWPTFAIDLIEKKGPPTKAVKDQVWLNPVREAPNDSPVSAQSTSSMIRRAQSQVSTDDLIGLASRILNTARGWMDNSQKTLPGYAERIVAVYLYEGEGGLNLNMSARTIRLLADRGKCAADQLANAWEPFAPDGSRIPGNQWQQHRWLRYRLLMREVEQLAREWTWVYAQESVSLAAVHQPPFDALIRSREATLAEQLVYGWEQPAFSAKGRRLTGWFNKYAGAAGTAILLDAEVPGEANLDPQVFDQARAPALHPKRLMIPPFE